MACGQRNKNERIGENGLNYVRKVAKVYSRISKEDSQIYIQGRHNNENLYNFEPLNLNRDNIIEIIKWQEQEKEPKM